MGLLQTEFEFTLPRGYVDDSGTLHNEGTMRLATAADEILPLKDSRVQQNPAYFSIILLSRVVTKLGSLNMVSNKVVEDLFSTDFSFLQDLYNRINQNNSSAFEAQCPKCDHKFDLELQPPGE